MQRIALLLIVLIGYSASATSFIPPGPDLISAKIQDGKLVFRTIQQDCNTLSGSLRPAIMKNRPKGDPKIYSLGVSRTKINCPPGGPTNTEVDVIVDLPGGEPGDNVQIWSGLAHVAYIVKRPQPNQELALVVAKPTQAPMQTDPRAKQGVPAPGVGGGANK